MGGDIDGDTLRALAPKATLTFPAPAVNRRHEVRVRGQCNFDAGTVALLEAAVAAPAFAIHGVVSVAARRHAHRQACLVLAHVIAFALPAVAGEVEEAVIGHLD